MKQRASLLERLDALCSGAWDLRPRAFSYRPYTVTPRQGRQTVRRRLLRRLLKGEPVSCPKGRMERF